MSAAEPTPAERKAEAYVADRFPRLVGTGLIEASVKEDFRAGFVQGLEAAAEAIVHADSDGLATSEIRLLLAGEV